MSTQQEEDPMLIDQEEAPIERVEFSDEVEEYWRRFQKQYDKYRIIVENRWLSMNKKKREEVLGESWKTSGDSEMPKGHRPYLVGLAPWREAIGSHNKLLPLKKGLDENHLRWPTFNQNDLTERQEAFLVLLESRATEHPMEFALLDHFRDNRGIAINEGLEVKNADFRYTPNFAVVAMSNIDPNRDEYGILHRAQDEEEARSILEHSQMWSELSATQVMRTQRRIYRFLERVIVQIMTNPAYKAVREDQKRKWRPRPPTAEEEERDDYDDFLAPYAWFLRNTMNYTSINKDLKPLALFICRQQCAYYMAQLEGLKSNPGLFYEYICDMREHSHHEILYWPSKEAHAWADYSKNINNTQMLSTYLLKALHTVTEGYDFWSYALASCEALERLNPGSPGYAREVTYLARLMLHRSHYINMWGTLVYSKPLRKYFFNRSRNDADPRPIPVTDVYLPVTKPKVAKLLSLLSAMGEEGVEEVISPENETWMDEIMALTRDSPGGQWMTNFAAQTIRDTSDAACALSVAKRMWDEYDLAQDYSSVIPEGVSDFQKHSNKLQQIRPTDEALNNIVSKHMVPRPDLKFQYPSVTQVKKTQKRRAYAELRRDSERNLAALWADLQPFLVERDAISVWSLGILGEVIPLATAENGDDITGKEPPPPPEPDRPSTPTTQAGPSGPDVTTTPTGPLQELTIDSPSRRPPAVRTPEKKTTNDGVKKVSPIRRARPDEDRPRRPQLDRRREREERIERMAVEADLVPPPAPVEPPGPVEPPPPEREYPKIELKRDNYELLRLLMTKDGLRRPGTVPWTDIVKIFGDIGFSDAKVGRASRGGLWTFTPKDELKEAQGIEKIISKDRPHKSNMTFKTARKWLLSEKGLGQYPGWDKFEEKFKEAGAPD